jgi:Raf kinase inhibitor-like YbhB/YbcL family protein
VVDDIDAPGGVFTHWTVWNLPVRSTGIPARLRWQLQGTNTFGRIGYSGPCPPSGPRHRYVFTLYALSQPLAAGNGASGDEVQKAIGDVAIAKGEFTGKYGR